MLVVENLSVSLDGFALQADLSLAPGRRVAVIGPSGAGKSMLLDVIAGFRAPDRGRVLWQGRDLTALPPQERPVSMLFQDQNLFPHLSVTRNLWLALRPDGGKPDPAQQTRVAQALERMGLGGMGERKPAELSGGQQARAALARVLLQARPIILLDEPFAALGPALRAEMLEQVRAVAQEAGALTLLVSHDPTDARGFAEEVVFVEAGQVQAPVETAALFDNPPEALRAYLGDSGA
ncbi:thiamine ABC transporter ATP-binding protein [Tropicibacter oceani]|uniref:ATP-binding cassette domain-containing protein n=1 Tax=Tropicibacter oceani TaxID=3058420 RepID=A0ABY8QL81_9RHOB|nr:ATP-binding cassette domain-containing protein [Tropicibacter oceani]WGW05396.1 ATP-binding cassette domain-containing protein [Tropicibacter oceani]